VFRQPIPVFHVSDSAAAEEFYCRGLGFQREFVHRPQDSADPCYLGLSRDGAHLHLSSFSGDGAAGSLAYLPVSDVDLLYAELVARGLSVDMPPTDQSWGAREMYVRDPDRNKLAFVNAPAAVRLQAPFELGEGLALLERTPRVLRAFLDGLPDEWTRADEGLRTWSPYTVLGHLIHGERTDWIPRARLILAQGPTVRFEPFDRQAQSRADQSIPLASLLEEFADLRARNLATLSSWQLSEAQLALPGEHPELGPVTLRQLLATWVVHDLGHLAQIARVLAKRQREAVGPWRAYLPVLDR
jgi:uncharacterized glyoxalase superfamily protein PhnB/uncharacterized damage-inducible protein DinB